MPLFGEDDFLEELPVDQHSCRLLGPTALVRHPSGCPHSRILNGPQSRSCRVLWVYLLLCRLCISDIGSLRSDRGEYGLSNSVLSVRAVFHSSAFAWPRSFDVSKQIIGQMFVHGVNVLISGVVAHLSSGNACVLYFLNILIDTTLGTYAAIDS